MNLIHTFIYYCNVARVIAALLLISETDIISPGLLTPELYAVINDALTLPHGDFQPRIRATIAEVMDASVGIAKSFGCHFLSINLRNK